MLSHTFFLVLIPIFFLCVQAKKQVPEGFVPEIEAIHHNVRVAGKDEPYAPTYSEEWAYVTVRPRCHLFYWLQKTYHSSGYKNRPLVLWHQGGPGASATGHGNMEIIGPIDIHGKFRNATWLQSVNIVYLDSPVGTGYSYVENQFDLTTDIDEIVDDLIAFSKVFFNKHTDFQTVPVYIFGESYGGKVAVTYAKALHQAMTKNEIKVNLKGYALGNSWVSPMDSVNTWGPFLFEMSCLDETGLRAVNAAAARAQKACDEGRWTAATAEWRNTQRAVMRYSHNVDFYNILNYKNYGFTQNPSGDGLMDYDYNSIMLHPLASTTLYGYMNTECRKKLGIIPSSVTWSGQRSLVFYYQEGDFMKDTLTPIDDTLNKTNLHVVIYQGQLDLICDTKGAMDYVQKLNWPGIAGYNKATRFALKDPQTRQVDTYVKAYNNFKFYWNLRAGHAVPAYMGPASLRMLERIVTNQDR